MIWCRVQIKTVLAHSGEPGLIVLYGLCLAGAGAAAAVFLPLVNMLSPSSY